MAIEAMAAAGVLMLQSLVAFAHLIVRNQKISAHAASWGGGLDGRRRDGARDKSSYEIWGEAECTKAGREGERGRRRSSELISLSAEAASAIKHCLGPSEGARESSGRASGASASP